MVLVFLFSSCLSVNASTYTSTCPFGSSDFNLFMPFQAGLSGTSGSSQVRIHGTYTKVTDIKDLIVLKCDSKQKNVEKHIMWTEMFLKKHLLKQMLQHFSLIAIGQTVNLPPPQNPSLWIKVKTSKVEVRLVWRIPFVFYCSLKGVICAAEVRRVASLCFIRTWAKWVVRCDLGRKNVLLKVQVV